jgi:hypothetical protein
MNNGAVVIRLFKNIIFMIGSIEPIMKINSLPLFF